MEVVKDSIFHETIQLLIAAHARNDEVAFRKVAEGVARELSVSNRHAEARRIQEHLRNGSRGAQQLQLHPAPRATSSLISFVDPQKRREQVILEPSAAAQIDRVVLEHRKRDALAQSGLLPSSRLLFWGPPGCGKTATAQVLARELGLPLAVVRLSSVITSYVGETATNLSKVFREAALAEMVLLFDEADALAKDREDPNDVGELKRVVNSLLQSLDEFVGSRGLLIFASNHQYTLDPAIWRRFDEVVEFPIPKTTSRLRFLQGATNGLRLNGSLPSLAKRLEGMSFADLERIAKTCMKSAILSGKGRVTTSELLTEAQRYRKKVYAATRTGKRRR